MNRGTTSESSLTAKVSIDRFRLGTAEVVGNKFVLVFLENRSDNPQGYPLELYVTNIQDIPNQVTISTPKFNHPTITETLAPGQIKQFKLNPNLRLVDTLSFNPSQAAELYTVSPKNGPIRPGVYILSLLISLCYSSAVATIYRRGVTI